MHSANLSEQLKEEKVKEEIMISKSIQDAARSQLDLFIEQGANGDLIQSAESVKAMLPVLMDQLIREGSIIVVTPA